MTLLNSFVLSIALMYSTMALAQNAALLTVEEKRIEKAQQAMPSVFKPLSHRVEKFKSQLKQARNLTTLSQLVIRHATALWSENIIHVDQKKSFDDRSLYWARLQMSKALRQSNAFKSLLDLQQEQILWKLEILSRGQHDVKFNKRSDKKILLTGFDPFFLDRHIDQSNPSGVAAIALDDLYITKDGISAEIETLIFPVRFEDFDRGMVEELLTPYLAKVDMIITVSMGRDNFDLERFPGLRRSAQAPDNLNVYTGASKQNPLIPFLKGERLKGPEFLEFSLPAKAMLNANGQFSITDNTNVITNRQSLTASSLSELNGHISVEGSGGGYLSNEISYRSLLLKEHYNPLLTVGHIHTPRFTGYKPAQSKAIISQIKQMISQAIKTN